MVVEAGEDEPEQEGLLTPHLNRREVIAASATVVILDLEVARAALIKRWASGQTFRLTDRCLVSRAVLQFWRGETTGRKRLLPAPYRIE